MSKATFQQMNNRQWQRKEERGVTAKAILIALVLIRINGYWVMEIEVIRYAGHPTIISIFFTSIFSLFLLLIWNLLLKRIAPILVISQGEMLVVYIMLNLASGLAGHDTLQVLVPILGHPFWFATPENELSCWFDNQFRKLCQTNKNMERPILSIYPLLAFSER